MKVLLIDQIAKVNFRYTFPMANGLASNGVDATLVIDQKEEAGDCTCRRIRLFNTDEKGIGKARKLSNYISSYRKIEKILGSGEYDVVHSEWYIFSPVDYYFLNRIKKKYGIKYVATVHDILPFNQKFYDMYFHKRLYGLADSIILQAPSNVDRFAKIFPEYKGKAVMVPHGHMLGYVEHADKGKSRERLGIPQDKTVFLFFGQIKKVKGVDVLLKAFSQLVRKHGDAYLVIAGSVWKSDFSICQEIIDNNDFDGRLKARIEYIPDEEVKDYYAASDVCVLPYTNIYQSGVIQLAYAYKKPVVCSGLPAFTQFVKEGKTGFIARPGDADSLCDAMERALGAYDRLESIGEAGYMKVKQDLDWNVLARKICSECYGWCN